MDMDVLWNRSVQFHGCACPALAIGFRAAIYALERFGLTEEGPYPILCTAESFSCSIDAIQTVLGCTSGNGKLHIQNKKRLAFRFCNTKTERGVNLTLKARLVGSNLTERILAMPVHDLFAISILDEMPSAAPKTFFSTACAIRSPELVNRYESDSAEDKRNGKTYSPERDW